MTGRNGTQPAKIQLVLMPGASVSRSNARRSTAHALAAAGLTVTVALAVAGCHRTVTGGASVDSPRIEGVSVFGNANVDDDDIVEGLANRPPEGFFFRRTYRRLDRLALEQDISRIESYYQRRGFYTAKVTGTDIEPAGDGAVRVTFRVVEGPPTRVAGLSIAGLGGTLARRHRRLDEEKAKLQIGDVFRHDRYVELKAWLIRWLSYRGYPHGQVEGKVDVDRDARTADVRLMVDSGPLAHFGRTTVKGLSTIPESAVTNRIAWEPGKRFDPAKMELTQTRLYQLGLFSAVRMDFEREGRPRLADVTISVAEARRHELRLGGGVEVSGGFDPSEVRILVRGRMDYVMRGLFSPLSTLHLDARPGWEWLQKTGTNNFVGEATASLDRADLFLPRMTGVVTVGYEQTQLETYVARGPLARLGLSRPLLDDRLQASLGWRFRYFDFSGVNVALTDPPTPAGEEPEGQPPDEQPASAAELIQLESPYRLGALEQSLSFDERDDALDPRRGFFAAVSMNEGAAALGGAFRFIRATGDARGYLPIGRRLVVAGRAFYGRVLGSQVLPVTERFYDGGANGHRGFAFRQLSPEIRRVVEVNSETGEMGEVRGALGGDETFLGSAEVRVDVAHIKNFPLGVVGFTDVGDVVCRVDGLRNEGELAERDVCPPLDFSNLHWAPGIGLRYDPIISIRLDFAYRLNRYGSGEPAAGDRFAFHFSLGQAF
jgi:translocation and assembly module TamA